MSALQPSLFNLDSPPRRPLRSAITEPERAFCLSLLGSLRPERLCPYCKGSYVSITYHLLRVCTGKWEASAGNLGAVEVAFTEKASASFVQTAPIQPEALRPVEISIPEVQRPEPSENMPGTWAVLPLTPAPEKKERPPHFWHWSRPSTNGSKATESYTPPLAVRRYSIPAIACSLYGAVQASVLSMQALSEYKNPRFYAFNKTCYDLDKKKVERYIGLLVFCGLDDGRVRWWVREAWTVFSEGLYHPWRDTKEKKGAARGLLALLGYQLGDDEPDGYGDIKNTKPAAFAEFLKQEEGTKEQ